LGKGIVGQTKQQQKAEYIYLTLYMEIKEE